MTDTPPMVARVARVIQEELMYGTDGGGMARDQLDALARAVIEVMREPTVGMWNALAGLKDGKENIPEAWTELIDAALGETP